jgi:hypothetical protein
VRVQSCYQAASPALARMLRDDVVATYGGDLPSAVACLDDNFEACMLTDRARGYHGNTAYLRILEHLRGAV